MERAGVMIILRFVVQESAGCRLETAVGITRAGNLFKASGAWGGRIAAMFGDCLPVEAIAPLMLVTDRRPSFCEAVVGSALRHLSFEQMQDGTDVSGGARLGSAAAATNKVDLNFAQLRLKNATATSVSSVMRSALFLRSEIEKRRCDRLPIAQPPDRIPCLRLLGSRLPAPAGVGIGDGGAHLNRTDAPKTGHFRGRSFPPPRVNDTAHVDRKVQTDLQHRSRSTAIPSTSAAAARRPKSRRIWPAGPADVLASRRTSIRGRDLK